MKFVLFGPKKEMNSYPTLQDEQNTVAQFLNRKAQEAMCCLDTQGPKKEMNSYPTLQDEQNTVAQFLNRKAQEAMCCLDTQETSDDLLPLHMKCQLQTFLIHMIRQWIKYPTHIRH